MTYKALYVMENLVKTHTNNSNVKTFCNYLISKGIDVKLLTTPNKENKDISNVGNAPVIKMGKDIYEGGRAYSFPLGFLLKNRKDYTHIWCYTSRASSFYSYLMKKLFGKKLIVKCDSVVPDDNAKGFRRFWQYLTIKLPLRNADLVVTESGAILKKAQDYSSNAIMVPNCINVPELEESEKDSRFTGGKQKIILSIGRVEPIKGIIDLIDAFFLFKQQKGSDWKLRIVGPLTNETYVSQIKARIKELALDKEVEVVGPKFGNDLYLEMYAATIYVIASHPLGDGRNNTLPYTMYFGCHPVVTNVGEMQEIVSPVGVEAIKPMDVKCLFNKLNEAADEPIDLNTLRSYVKKHMNWEDFLPNLMEAFNEREDGEEEVNYDDE